MSGRSVPERRPRPEVVARFNAELEKREPHLFVMVKGPPALPANYAEVIYVDPKRGVK